MTNYGVSITDADTEFKKPSTSLFITSSTIGLEYALRKIIESEFKRKEEWKTIKGYAYVPELEKAWRFHARFSKRPEFDIKTYEIDYPKTMTKTEDLFSEYDFKPVGELSLKSKTITIREKIDDFIKKNSGDYHEFAFYLTTGIDFNTNFSFYAIIQEDRNHIRDLLKDGKRVNLIAIKSHLKITSTSPFEVLNISLTKFMKKHPKDVDILRLKFSDLSE